MLYCCATPIGNLDDISYRAVETLKKVSLIACEDTRHTRILTSHYQIDTPLISYFQHNELKRADYLLKLLKEGRDIALVSDAGMPGISDPGFKLIKLAIDNSVPVTVIPGACAFLCALILSGMPTDKFIYEGFIPHKSTARKKRLLELKQERRTIIFYESPHRIIKTLEDILEALGDIQIACVRELTKRFEEVQRDSVSRLLKHFRQNKPRGEFVIIFNLKRSLKNSQRLYRDL